MFIFNFVAFLTDFCPHFAMLLLGDDGGVHDFYHFLLLQGGVIPGRDSSGVEIAGGRAENGGNVTFLIIFLILHLL